jgi:hypothetical protein
LLIGDGLEQNAELFVLTYGALVVQLVKDYEDYEEVNKQLERMYVDASLLCFRSFRFVSFLALRSSCWLFRDRSCEVSSSSIESLRVCYSSRRGLSSYMSLAFLTHFLNAVALSAFH